MNFLKYAFPIHFLVFSTLFCHSQPYIDSLTKAAQSPKLDTNTVVACNTLAEEIVVSKPDVALKLSKRALDISLKIQFRDGITWSYSTMSEAYEYLGQTDSAISSLEAARTYKIEFGDTQGVARMDMNIGTVYLNQGYFKPASEALFRALAIFDKLKDKQLLSRTYNNLGLLFRKTKNYNTALEYYKRSLSLKKELNDYNGQALTLGNISMLLYQQKDYKGAEKFALEGYEVCQKHDLMDYAAMCLLGAAQAYANTGKYEEARASMLSIAKLLDQYPDEQDQASYFMIQANLSRADKKYNEAILFAMQAADIYKKREMLEQLQSLYADISKMHSENKQPSLAIEWLDKSVAIADTIFQKENVRQVNEMNIIYKTQSKEKENENLRTENRLEQLRSETSERQRNFLLIFLCVFLGLGVWIFRLLWQKNKAYEQLQENKKALEVAIEQKDTLLRELHHRVKNNLQVVTGLLDLQMARIKDEDVIKALNDGKNRIRSMALIHQKLYRTDDLKSVDMQEYFEKLLQEIRTGFALPDKRIDTKIQASNINLDIDVAIPLGLVVNELVTNSFKYAFAEKEVGEIHIILNKVDGKHILKISDNGPGYNSAEKTTKATLGLRLVNMLTKQIRGTLEIHNFSGTEVEIQF